VHPLFVQIRYQPDVGNDHGGPLQAFESEEGVANDAFIGFGIRGEDNRVATDVFFMGDAFF